MDDARQVLGSVVLAWAVMQVAEPISAIFAVMHQAEQATDRGKQKGEVR